jgi:hypothetical protein
MYLDITRDEWDKLYTAVYAAYEVALYTDSNTRKLLGATLDYLGAVRSNCEGAEGRWFGATRTPLDPDAVARYISNSL